MRRSLPNPRGGELVTVTTQRPAKTWKGLEVLAACAALAALLVTVLGVSSPANHWAIHGGTRLFLVAGGLWIFARAGGWWFHG